MGGKRYTLGSVQIIGPSGGCVGAALDVVLELGAL
jgi:hypothetical protein